MRRRKEQAAGGGELPARLPVSLGWPQVLGDAGGGKRTGTEPGKGHGWAGDPLPGPGCPGVCSELRAGHGGRVQRPSLVGFVGAVWGPSWERRIFPTGADTEGSRGRRGSGTDASPCPGRVPLPWSPWRSQEGRRELGPAAEGSRSQRDRARYTGGSGDGPYAHGCLLVPGEQKMAREGPGPLALGGEAAGSQPAEPGSGADGDVGDGDPVAGPARRCWRTPRMAAVGTPGTWRGGR